MPPTPEDLREEAARLRVRADEITDDNPTASDYHAKRAAWCEYLARQEERTRDAD